MKADSALIIVDVQIDFCPGGALAVPEGDRIVPVINRCIEQFIVRGMPVIATRDWHPPQTSHFRDFGGIWPVHCVQETPGARFHPDLRLPPGAIVVSKGMDPTRDDYSAFFARDSRGVPLDRVLAGLGVKHLYMAGMATDYCVKESALEALRQGLEITIIADGIRGVDLQEGDSQRALAEITAAGARVIASTGLAEE
jgi:nicotinamidase/pyrazinamidase